MLNRLQAVEDRYEQLNTWLSDPDIVNDPKKLREYSKEQSDIQLTVETYRQYKTIAQQLLDAKSIMDEQLDTAMRDMAKEEVKDLETQAEFIEEHLKTCLLTN